MKSYELVLLQTIKDYQYEKNKLLEILNDYIKDYMRNNPDTIYIYDKNDVSIVIEIAKSIIHSINDKD